MITYSKSQWKQWSVNSGYMIPEVWCDCCNRRYQAEDASSLKEYRKDLAESGWQVDLEDDKSVADICI